MVKETGDFEVLVNTFQAAEQGHITRKRDPDIALTCPFQGGAYKREKSVTRLHALRGDPDPPSTQAGYAGAIAYGEFLLQSLKNKSFETNMKEKTSDTYKDWWYEQPDPLYYLDKESSK
jgi:nitrogenase molybdenum-iron protein alpha chain